MRRVTAADANRYFSRILRDVRDGETVTVTSRGVEVAMIVPIGKAPSGIREQAKAALMARLRDQKPVGADWTRDELHESDGRCPPPSPTISWPMRTASTMPTGRRGRPRSWGCGSPPGGACRTRAVWNC